MPESKPEPLELCLCGRPPVFDRPGSRSSLVCYRCWRCKIVAPLVKAEHVRGAWNEHIRLVRASRIAP
jgi:hypothetical protein